MYLICSLHDRPTEATTHIIQFIGDSTTAPFFASPFNVYFANFRSKYMKHVVFATVISILPDFRIFLKVKPAWLVFSRAKNIFCTNWPSLRILRRYRMLLVTHPSGLGRGTWARCRCTGCA